jgi:predicted lipid-binding transport protein (Tim44 family)
VRHVVLAIVLAVAVALSPAAFAKMGSGSSFGSRGSRTYDRPIERTYTPPPAMAPAPMPGIAPAPAMGQPARAGGSSFLGGVLGGLTGFGLGSLLFSHSAFAGDGGMSPLGGILGLLLQVALLVFVVRWLLRLVRRSLPGASPGARAPRPAAAPARMAKEFEPTEADKQAFGGILVAVQQAWSNADLAGMRRLATPEMVAWLADDLTANASRGVRNIVDEVSLLKGDVVEAWREGGREFATAVLTFAARDYSVRADTQVVVEGDPRQPTQSCEAWTFVRAGGGQWLLSAVERG